MKKHILTLTTIFALGSVLFTGCNKEDTTPPVITLEGANPFELPLNSNFVDPGATADDDQDGDLTSSIIVDDSDLDLGKDKVGSYNVNYSVSDAAGNIGTESRIVNVYNELTSSLFAGTWACDITTGPGSPYSYSDGLAISTSINNCMEWNKFGDYGQATAKLNIKIVGTQVIIPTQSFTCGSPTAVLRQFNGSGAIVGAGGPGTVMTLQIAETVNGQTDNFTYVFTK